ncbi:MAG TPA: class I SAM-dependent methyltransferase [Myxococcales bacterium]
MTTVWDQRFAGDEFAYGLAPNRWLEETAPKAIAPGGKVLSLGEGEGRNAVWLARQGFQVDAVDGSSVGMEKAQRLAAKAGVSIQTTVADLASYRPAEGAYDAVVLVYVHLPPALRPRVHQAAQKALKPGGVLVLEAFTPRQLGRPSGGPPVAEMLYEPTQLASDFPALLWDSLAEKEIVLDEGALHRGPAMVVRALGRLPKDPKLGGCF